MVPESSAVKRFDINTLSSLIPRFGNFCGPGWSAGRSDLGLSLKEIQAGEVWKFYDSQNKLHESKLDELCKQHDVAYKQAEGLPSEAILISQADTTLLKGLVTQFSSLYPEEKPYASLAVVAFSAKITTYDVPSTWAGTLKSGLASAATYLKEHGQPTDPFVMMEGNNIHSVLVDSEGRLVASFSDGLEALTVKLGPDLNVTEFIKQYVDEFGEIYDETRIQARIDSALSELTHSTDGVEDLHGVIVGKVTQDKLDQFAELGSAALSPETISGSDHDTAPITEPSAKQIFSSLDIPLNSDASDALDAWFAESTPIIVEPYRWESVDSNLKKFWNYGTEDTLPAYDLGSALDEAGWSPAGGDWSPPEVQPEFSDIGQENQGFDTTPIFFSAQEFDSIPEASFSGDLGGAFPVDSFSSTGGGTEGFAGDSFNSFIDPLVIKLSRGSVHTTNLAGSNVIFDMNGDGHKERTAWITADEAFLVVDKNGNGQIDDIREMFSELTSPHVGTGFGALALLDSNRDGWVDRFSDKAFGTLRLWTDINQNGITDKGELHLPGEFGIDRFGAHAIAMPTNRYDNGNLLLNVSSYIATKGNLSRYGEVSEVLFNYGDRSSVANIYLSDQATTLRTANGKVIEMLTDARAQTVNASLSGVNVLVGGAGDVLNAGNAGQSLLIANGGATLNGSAGDVHFVVNGSRNIVNTGKGNSVIDVHGDANTINAAKGDVDLNVDGSRNKISVGSGADVDLDGTANVLTVVAGAKDVVVAASGAGHVVNASNASVAIEAHASITLNGTANTITMAGNATLAGKASGGTLTVSGEGNQATLSGAFIAITEDAGLTLTGVNQQIVMAGEADLTMKSTGAGSTIFVFGEDNQLNSSKANVILAEGAGLNLNGSGDKLTLLGDATLKATGIGQVIDVYGKGNELSVTRSTVYERAHAEVDLGGAGNVVKVTLDNSKLAPQEITAQHALEQQVAKALEKYTHLTGEVPGGYAPADVVGVAANDSASQTASAGASPFLSVLTKLFGG